MNQKNQKEGGGEGGWGRSPDGVVRIVYFGETKREECCEKCYEWP